MPEPLSRSPKENTRKLIVMQIFVLKNFFPQCLSITSLLGVYSSECNDFAHLSRMAGQRHIKWLAFLRTDMHIVRSASPAFMQHSAMASFSVHDPLFQMELVHRLGSFPICLHLAQRPREKSQC